MLKEDKLSHYIETYKIEWADSLPENCPPQDVLVPEEEQFYRLLLNEDIIVDEDWKSYAELYPGKKYSGDQLILASGLSIFNTSDLSNLKKLPSMRRFKGVARIKLYPTDGVLKKTGRANHYTWWGTTAFNADNVEIIKK